MGVGLLGDQTANMFPIVDEIRIDIDLNLFNGIPLSAFQTLLTASHVFESSF
jgi:hypothetical protein